MTILDTIVEKKKEELRSLAIPGERLTGKPPKSLRKALEKPAHPLGIIAEVKKASPSKGVLCENFNPVAIASEYEAINVSGISVLTDESFFQGHADHLTAVKKYVDTPVLRKDFIINEKQVQFSERIGADAILLIAAILGGPQLAVLHDTAVGMGLDVLVEVHSEPELEKVLAYCSPDMIGINNRDLHSFETDLEVTLKLSRLIPDGTLVISESGIHAKKDTDRLLNENVHGLLVGEAFMKSADKQALLQSLFHTEVKK